MIYEHRMCLTLWRIQNYENYGKIYIKNHYSIKNIIFSLYCKNPFRNEYFVSSSIINLICYAYFMLQVIINYSFSCKMLKIFSLKFPFKLHSEWVEFSQLFNYGKFWSKIPIQSLEKICKIEFLNIFKINIKISTWLIYEFCLEQKSLMQIVNG